MKYLSFVLVFLLACSNEEKSPDSKEVSPAVLAYNIIKIFPLDTSAFTEGLEWFEGYLYESTGLESKTRIQKTDLKTGAIVWGTNKIIKIDANTARVEAFVDLTGILDLTGTKYDPNKLDVLNGIAYLREDSSFLITGKYWPAMFQIRFF